MKLPKKETEATDWENRRYRQRLNPQTHFVFIRYNGLRLCAGWGANEIRLHILRKAGDVCSPRSGAHITGAAGARWMQSSEADCIHRTGVCEVAELHPLSIPFTD